MIENEQFWNEIKFVTAMSDLLLQYTFIADN